MGLRAGGQAPPLPDLAGRGQQEIREIAVLWIKAMHQLRSPGRDIGTDLCGAGAIASLFGCVFRTLALVRGTVQHGSPRIGNAAERRKIPVARSPNIKRLGG
ncbi:hypothetical protein KU6B_17580 [Mameliella alba]|nr:hypothetical protein KU6B_17580 [Mameliella alba]